MNTLTIVALILIFLGGIGAIILTIAQSISSTSDKEDIIRITKSENSALKKDLIEIKKERNSLNKSLEKRDLNIQKQNAEIILLSQKLSEKSEFIQNSLTGGNGFLFIDMRSFFPKKNEVPIFLFRIENNSKFPQYNVIIDVFDFDEVKKNEYKLENYENSFISLENYKASKILQINYQEIPPHEYRDIDRKFNIKPGRYYLQVHTRSKASIEKIVILKIGEGLYYGFQVFDLKGNLLKQLIKEEMPKHIKKQLLDQLKTIPNNMKLNISQ